MTVNGGPRRAEVKRADTYHTVLRQTTVQTQPAVADEQLESLGADIFALKMLLPALLSRVGRLDPILASSLQAPEISNRGSQIRWQDEVSFLARSAKETDNSLNRLLAGSYSQPAGEEILRQLPTKIEHLQQTLAR